MGIFWPNTNQKICRYDWFYTLHKNIIFNDYTNIVHHSRKSIYSIRNKTNPRSISITISIIIRFLIKKHRTIYSSSKKKKEKKDPFPYSNSLFNSQKLPKTSPLTSQIIFPRENEDKNRSNSFSTSKLPKNI